MINPILGLVGLLFACAIPYPAAMAAGTTSLFKKTGEGIYKEAGQLDTAGLPPEFHMLFCTTDDGLLMTCYAMVQVDKETAILISNPSPIKPDVKTDAPEVR